MKTCLAFATLAGAATLCSLGAVAATFSHAGRTMTYDEFKPHTLDVTVATDRATGHKMNLVRLPNGHLMALVPADRYLALMSAPEETLTGGPAGGLTDRN